MAETNKILAILDNYLHDNPDGIHLRNQEHLLPTEIRHDGRTTANQAQHE